MLLRLKHFESALNDADKAIAIRPNSSKVSLIPLITFLQTFFDDNRSFATQSDIHVHRINVFEWISIGDAIVVSDNDAIQFDAIVINNWLFDEACGKRPPFQFCRDMRAVQLCAS